MGYDWWQTEEERRDPQRMRRVAGGSEVSKKPFVRQWRWMKTVIESCQSVDEDSKEGPEIEEGDASEDPGRQEGRSVWMGVGVKGVVTDETHL